MKKLKNKLKDKPHVVLSIPVVLCAITFVTNLIAALKDGNIDGAELHQLLSTADGFESVIMLIIMFVLNNKNK